MEKSGVPTTEHKVSCDTYDTTISCKLHETEGKEQKLLIEISKKGEKQSVSLFKEDVEMLATFLNTVSEYSKPRN